MTTDAFMMLVEEQADRFRTRARETEASVRVAEEDLGVRLPQSLRWFVKKFGYSILAGIPNLTEMVSDTLAARQSLNLPNHLVVLTDGDFGAVLILDTATTSSPGENPIYSVAKGLIEACERLPDRPRFESFGEYLQSRIQLGQEFTMRSQFPSRD